MDGADEEMVFVSETGFSIFSGSKAGMSIGVEDELTIDSKHLTQLLETMAS